MKFAVKQNKIAIFCFITAIFSLLFLVAVFSIKAADDQGETQKKIEELEKKAEVYREIIDLKQKQQQSLSNQVEIIETESKKLESEIELNKKKIEELNSQISKLEEWIKENNRALEGQKKILAGLLQVQYENKNDIIFQNFFNGENKEGIFNFITKEDRVKQVGEKISEIIKIIQSTKDSLTKEKEDLENKKGEIIELYYEQEERVTQLEAVKNQKEVLITQTQGEESKYQTLLARVEEQKRELLGDIDLLYSEHSEEIDKLLASLPKPKSGLASTSWYYSQKDKRWGNNRIGQSNSLVKDYGCALTSVAMVFTHYGQTTSPGTLAKKRIYDWDLIYWPKNGSDIGLSSNVVLVRNTNHTGVNWNEIDEEIEDDRPVIVYIKAKSEGGHYVVIHHKSGSDYVVHDPYWGSNIYLSSSMRLLSALYNVSISKKSIDQMIFYEKK